VGAGDSVWSVGFAPDGKAIAFGTTFRRSTDNNRGPLQKALRLDEADSAGVSLAESASSETRFIRAQDRLGNLNLAVKSGDKPGTNILQVLRSENLKHEIPRDYTSGDRHIAYSFSPDGSQIASAGNYGVLTLYSTSTSKTIAECVGHTSDVWAVAFSPDGKTLVSGSYHQTIRLWDVGPSACRNLLTVFVGSDNEWVAWTPQGYYTASAHGDKYIGWHVNQGLDGQAKFYPAAQFQKQFYRPDVVAEFLNKRDIDLAVRGANEKRGGELRFQPVLGAADVLATLPPMISISSPERNEITVDQKMLRLRAEVLSNTLPIADVKVLLNGVQVSGKGGPPAAKARRRPIELDLELEPGVNILSVIASNEKATSEPETRKIVYRASEIKDDKPKLIALAIGISRYQHSGIALKYGAADAAAIEAALKTQNNPNNELFGAVEVHVLPNDKATRSAIVRELDWLNREGTQRDTRVLFLSGHGDVDSSKNYFFFSHEHDPDNYDLGDVPWDLLIRKLTAAKGKAVLFVDTCHAGAVMGNTPKPDPKPLSQIIKEMQTQELGLVVFAASTGSENSVELDRFRHGAFYPGAD
jgi:WD40 repeat protein